MTQIYVWLTVLIIAVAAEAATSALIAIWFAPPAVLCMILSLVGVPMAVQIPVFLLLSMALCLLFYRKLKDNMAKKSEKTNIDALIGKTAVVEEDIMPLSVGRVKVGGMSWSAYCEGDGVFAKKGEYVKIQAINGVKLLVMGTVDVGGSGCVCPEHVMLKALLSALTYRKDDVVIMDMEAGLEHLGRGTAANMDQFLVVVEPGARSVQTYGNVKRLAADLGVKRVRVVANKVRDERDEAYVRSVIPAEDFLGCIHYNPEIMDADRNGKSPYDFSRTAMEEIRNIKAILDRDEK